jgi:hypothetical protein
MVIQITKIFHTDTRYDDDDDSDNDSDDSETQTMNSLTDSS